MERRASKVFDHFLPPPPKVIDSLSRSCFRAEFQEKNKVVRPPKGAKYKLPQACKALSFIHDFDDPPLREGIVDAGTTHVKVLPACGYGFPIQRRVSERQLGDWGAALVLVDALMDHHRADFVKGGTVLELGCGLGVPGLVCASMGANVILTDRNDKEDRHHKLLDLLQWNVTCNFMGPPIRPPGIGTGRAGLVDLTWSEQAARDLVEEYGYFDFVISSDCVYQPAYGNSWEDLAACFDVLCGPGTRCYVSFQRRPHDNVEGFLDAVHNKYRFLTSKKTTLYTVPAGPATIEIYTLRRLSEPEQFHIDVQSSAMVGPGPVIGTGEDNVIEAWRGPMPTKFYDAGTKCAQSKKRTTTNQIIEKVAKLEADTFKVVENAAEAPKASRAL